MREILFRGKRADNGEWIEGELIHSIYKINDTCVGKFGCDLGFYQVIPETVGQYTGLTDKNGTKIFEGDIVDFNIRGDDESYGVVKYSAEETEFYLAYDNLTLGLGRNNYSWELEVIGNTHDNPELLEEG